jgi:DNA-binding NtrC family response regulator
MPQMLILDDEPTTRRHLSSDLRRFFPQITVISCETLHETRLVLKTNHIDLALIDYSLHDGYGDDILHDLPTGCITIGMSEQFLPADIRQRFMAFLNKPFKSEELFAILKDRHF